MSNIKKVIIWGHVLHTHTHSYIHNAFYNAFKYLGYDTYWFDDTTNVADFDFSHSLFISEHQVDNRIPKRNDCLYIIHFLEIHKYANLPRANIIDLKCAFRDMKREKEADTSIDFTPLNDKHFEFYRKKQAELTYYMMWATDIFPDKIQHNIDNLAGIAAKRNTAIVNYIGHHLRGRKEDIDRIYENTNITLFKYGGTFQRNHPLNKTIDENMELIQVSNIAPAFQTDSSQIRDNYVPCRIFKNISYGRMGITNSKFVNALFNNKLICDENFHACVAEGIAFESQPNKLAVIKELMEYVRDNHTYIQRISAMKEFINQHTSFIL
jgi:hypothetical protein